MKFYEPGELIFKQNTPSPMLHVIIKGSVKAVKMNPQGWGPDVKVLVSSFFDGSVFGEADDYDAQKDNISARMLREL